MIEYLYSMMDKRDVTESSTRGRDRWQLKLTHKPTGLFVHISGVGKFEHQLDIRRNAYDSLQTLVDTHYIEEYKKNHE